MTDEVTVTANLTDVEARALLVLIDMGSKEFRRRIDIGMYAHQCQHTLAADVLARGEVMHKGITAALARREAGRL
jgi:hypothetical protein